AVSARLERPSPVIASPSHFWFASLLSYPFFAAKPDTNPKSRCDLSFRARFMRRTRNDESAAGARLTLLGHLRNQAHGGSQGFQLEMGPEPSSSGRSGRCTRCS